MKYVAGARRRREIHAGSILPTQQSARSKAIESDDSSALLVVGKKLYRDFESNKD